MLDATSKFYVINEAYARGDFIKAKALIDSLIDIAPLSPQGLSARYLRARGYEDGLFGEVKLNLALHDYKILMDHSDLCGSDGIVGYARVIFNKNQDCNKERAAKLLLRAVELDSNVKAMMMLGLIYDEGFDDSLAAGKWYLKAYRHGLPWGLRYYARLQSKKGRRFLAFLSHLIASLTSPVLVALKGVRSPFK